MADDETSASAPERDPRARSGGRAGRPAPTCSACGSATRFEGGKQVHDLWAELFVCESCGRETYRSYGRGSV